MSWQNKIENKRKVQQLSTVEDPQKVKVLILTDQKAIYSDFYFITRFVNIVKLDLSYNKLSGFSIGFSFRNFKYLRTLFLHYNKFSSIKSVALVKQCDKLEYLTLFGNPLQETKTRHYFVNQIMSLKLMDDKIIRMQQRNPQIMIRNNYQNIKLPFPIINIAQSQNSTYFLSAVIAELRFLRQKYLNANPIIKIQRWFRRKLNKNNKINISKDQISYQKVERQKIIPQRTIQKLMTQQLIPHKLNQQKILSLLKMNYTFLQFLRKKSQKKVFALRQFCQKNNLKYENQSKKIICLRIPNNFKQIDANNHLQLIIKSSQKYLLRRIGSQNSMNFNRKYPILNILLTKRKKRQPKYFKQQIIQPNKSLSQKINIIQDRYCSQFVLIKQDHQKIYNFMKNQYFKSIKLKQPFPFCFQQILERSAAAVSIQRMWRGYIIRKKLKNSYLRVTRNHAAWLIQRYIRNLGFRKRTKLFLQLVDYIKKQIGSNQLIIPFDSILNFKNKYDSIKNSINFALPDQKIKYLINSQNQILLQKNQIIIIPSYFSQYLKINISENRQQKNQNILDILFKGVVAVRYLSMPVKQKSLNSSRVKINVQTKIQNKNMKGLIKDQTGQKKQQISQRQQDKLMNFIVFQYKSIKQCLNRKFFLALYSYNMMQNSLLKSYKLNLNEHKKNLLKNINEQVNQHYFFIHIDQQNQEDLQQTQQNLKQRQISNEMKFKFFVQQKEYITKIKVFYPIQPKIDKKDYSLALPLRQLQRKSSLRSNNSSNKLKKQQSVSNAAHISRTIISIFPNDTQQSANFIYRQREKILKSKLKYRYDNQYMVDQQKYKSLQKCQSLQPRNKNQGETSFNQFIRFNNNVQKNLTTQGHLGSVTQNLRKKYKQFDNSFVYNTTDELELQNKKKKIYFLKNTHRNKLLESSQYKQEQLSKLRQKMRQQLQQNYRIIQSARLQNVVANTRKHKMVKRALSKQVQQIKNFQRNFMKKGNSSIRKDLLKFQNDRSSKSPDNQSIYESMKSLDGEILKQHLLKHSKQIFNSRTQIKQFSIDGSEGQHDISLAIDLDKKSKQISKRFGDDHKNDNSKNKQHIQRVLNKKCSKKDIKKKKLVHSVFPQQFYPLKQTKKIGFQLPKISHK